MASIIIFLNPPLPLLPLILTRSYQICHPQCCHQESGICELDLQPPILNYNYFFFCRTRDLGPGVRQVPHHARRRRGQRQPDALPRKQGRTSKVWKLKFNCRPFFGEV